MNISGLGILLRRLEIKDIELVRSWRNSPEIQQWMIYQNDVSPEQQVIWFESINNPFNYYFVIEQNGFPVGIIYAKDVNGLSLEGEGGIFIGVPAFRETDIPARASILWIWVCFTYFKIKNSKIRVKKKNTTAVAFNTFLGYQRVGEEGEVLFMELEKDSFLNSKALRLLKKYDFKFDQISIVGKPSSTNLPEINSFLSPQG